jgi:hypothetical protein
MRDQFPEDVYPVKFIRNPGLFLAADPIGPMVGKKQNGFLPPPLKLEHESYAAPPFGVFCPAGSWVWCQRAQFSGGMDYLPVLKPELF